MTDQTLPAPLSPALAHLVARIYDETRRPVPRSLEVCTACCMEADIERQILHTPVSEISAEHIREWYGAAFGGDGGLHVYLWLMPRILDLLSRDVEVVPWGNEAVFRRCQQTAPVPDWPRPWPELMAAFGLAYIDARLDAPQPEFDVSLCMWSFTGLPLAPLLERLEAATVPRLAKAILRDWGQTMPWFSEPSWDDHAALAEAQAWFARKDLAERMLIYGADHDGPDADLALDAGDVLWGDRKL